MVSRIVAPSIIAKLYSSQLTVTTEVSNPVNDCMLIAIFRDMR